ncbi:hypothetical protein LZ30DRAFT_29510 [Colletotrichum cereale]|nr:hypothetical protein LZ30DRAFT_29510 [Colletotrichum cereale]
MRCTTLRKISAPCDAIHSLCVTGKPLHHQSINSFQCPCNLPRNPPNPLLLDSPCLLFPVTHVFPKFRRRPTIDTHRQYHLMRPASPIPPSHPIPWRLSPLNSSTQWREGLATHERHSVQYFLPSFDYFERGPFPEQILLACRYPDLLRQV